LSWFCKIRPLDFLPAGARRLRRDAAAAGVVFFDKIFGGRKGKSVKRLYSGLRRAIAARARYSPACDTRPASSDGLPPTCDDLRRPFSACDGCLATCDSFPASCDALLTTCDGLTSICAISYGFATARILACSPGEKERPAHGFGFAAARPVNPVARVFRKAADDSPSSWGAGRDEGERSNQFLSRCGVDVPLPWRGDRSAAL
jgi:hypothetical protein